MIGSFSFSRAFAIFSKEIIQMRRDRITLSMMLGIPLMQLIMFGFAINTDPRHLPTLVELHDNGPAVRSIIHGLEASRYFTVKGIVAGKPEVETAFKKGEALFVVSVPENFERDLLRGSQPQILLDADATDPVATSAAAGAFSQILDTALKPVLEGSGLESMTSQPVTPVIHKRYNPAGRTSVNIVPGLLGIILTMTMTLMTSIALTRETERGTLEALLSTPARPAEVMVGKITPFVVVGLMQTALMLVLARSFFGVPFVGSFIAFGAAVACFILVNLAIGFFCSTVARTQMQAMQMTFFFFLPSILLSGFMFPFDGMPKWARTIGEGLPTTHFIRVVRSVMLKGAELREVLPELGSLCIILSVVTCLAIFRYRRTLD
ncbi:ABC transporter permease [Kordiimonas pumila]|uniref:ABC transporter permease n=1 Tax=Kordiimonas pumila TaxID=2161677 RepID=A0ABV7D8N4_9PROT|nr:ABC transporter permease [Kordiimonas pumila]